MRWPLVTLGLVGVGCSLTSLESLDDYADSGGYSGLGGGAGMGGGSNACVPSCERAVQAGCQNFTMQNCLADCQAKGESIPTACVSTYGALLLCAASENGSYICDSNGNPALVTCNTEAAAVANCTGSSTGGTGGGTSDSGACDPGVYLGATCDDVNGATPACTDCINTNCCDEVDTCFAATDCAGLYACSAICYTAPDFSQCVYDTCPACAVAVEPFNAINQCLYDHCSGACGV